MKRQLPLPYRGPACTICGAPETISEGERGSTLWGGAIFTAALRYEPDRCEFCTLIEKGLLVYYVGRQLAASSYAQLLFRRVV
jgi:hypothetical protein